MAKFDPPWRLDPLKNIVNVGWGAGSFVEIGIGAAYSFGTPSGLSMDGIPGYGRYQYAFQPNEWTVKRPDVKNAPTLDLENPSPKLIASIISGGKGNVTHGSGPDFKDSVSAGATVLIPLRDQDWTVTLTLPGNLASKPGDPTTFYDGYFEIEYFYTNGSHGFGNGLFTHATIDQVDAIRADVNGSNSIATWHGSVTITNTYDEPGLPVKHSATHSYFVDGGKFKGKKPNGDPKIVPIDIDGITKFSNAGISDINPISQKTVSVRYIAKTKKVSVS